SRVLIRGVVLLLLFTQPSWANIFCSCNHPDESEHACCQRAQHGSLAVEPHQEVSVAHSSSQCAGEEVPALDAELGNLLRTVMGCCLSAEEAGVQTVAPLLTEQLPVENATSPVQIGAQTIIAPASVYLHPHHHKRPLYMAFSCWLI